MSEKVSLLGAKVLKAFKLSWYNEPWSINWAVVLELQMITDVSTQRIASLMKLYDSVIDLSSYRSLSDWTTLSLLFCPNKMGDSVLSVRMYVYFVWDNVQEVLELIMKLVKVERYWFKQFSFVIFLGVFRGLYCVVAVRYFRTCTEFYSFIKRTKRT